MKVLIVIPAFNEEQKLGNVLSDLKKHGYQNIVVVDDGSSDKTENVARMNHVQVLRHRLNRGLGAALGTGFAFAQTQDVDYLVTFDADSQHQAKDIKGLLKPLINHKADIVIGSRFKRGLNKIPQERRLANLFSNLMVLVVYGVKTSDSQSGLRAFNRRAINKISIKTDRMEVSSEFFMEMKKHDLKLSEIDIKPIYDEDTILNSHQERLSTFKLPLRLIARLVR